MELAGSPLRRASGPRSGFQVLSIELLHAADEIRCRLAAGERFPLGGAKPGWNCRVVDFRIIDYDGEQECFVIREGGFLGLFEGEVPFHAEEAALGSQSVLRDDRKEQRTVVDAAPQFCLPIVSRLQLLPIEEYVNAGSFQAHLELFRCFGVAAGVAQKYGTGSQLRCQGGVQGRGNDLGVFGVTFPPAAMEFTDELENSPAAIDFCRLAEVLKEQHLIAVVAHLSIDDIATLASGRKTLPLGHAHEETCQPAAEAAAKNHQALPIQLVEQQRRLPRPRLQRVEELNE